MLHACMMAVKSRSIRTCLYLRSRTSHNYWLKLVIKDEEKLDIVSAEILASSSHSLL